MFQRWAEGRFDNRQAKHCPAGCACDKHKPRPNNFHGGQTGKDFASVLVPAGYVREYQLFCGRRYTLDFAHVEAKVNIELDGPHHYTTPEQDSVRDAKLGALGWKIIRIRHE